MLFSIDDSYYNASLSNELYKYYSDKNKTYNNTRIGIYEKELEQDLSEIIEQFK